MKCQTVASPSWNPHFRLWRINCWKKKFPFGSMGPETVSFREQLPSLKLTWPLKMDGWNTTFLLGRPIFRGYVSFREQLPNLPNIAQQRSTFRWICWPISLTWSLNPVVRNGGSLVALAWRSVRVSDIYGSGQIIATSHHLGPQNVALRKGIPWLFFGKFRLGNYFNLRRFMDVNLYLFSL